MIIAVLLLVVLAPARADDYAKMAAELTKAAIAHGARRVAVLPFREVGLAAGTAGTFVSEKITGPMLGDDRLTIVERTMLQTVLREQKLQLSGAADPRSIKELGKVLGVDAIITGTILALKNDKVEINARLIDAESARVLSVSSARVEKEWSDSIAGSVFDIQVPPLNGFENDGMKDALASEDETNCSSARSRAAGIELSMVDLKARYWAARMKSPGFDRTKLTTNPGSEIEDAGVKADFYDRLKRYYQESGAAVTDSDIERLNDSQHKIKQISELCHGA